MVRQGGRAKGREQRARKITVARDLEVDDAQGNKYHAIRSPMPPLLGLVTNEEGATINHSMLIKPAAK